MEVTLADLKKLPQYTVPATLECTGNGRGFYTPKVPGIQWKRGAVGNAEWRGPRLSDVLKLAGMNDGAAFIEFDGADTGVAKTPDFVRSMPMKKAMHPATMLALKMNGETPADPRFSGAVDRAGLGWHELGEVGDADHAAGSGQRRILHEPRIPHPANSAAARDAGAAGGAGSDRGHAGEVVDYDAG